MNKYLIAIILILCFIPLTNAGEIVKEDKGSVYIYGAIEKSVGMSGFNDGKTNFNRTICVNSTCIEGEIYLLFGDAYNLEYTFITALNDSDYISRTVNLEQIIISSSWITGIEVERICKLDSVEIGRYKYKYNKLVGLQKPNTFVWVYEDNYVKFGDIIIKNQSLAFTQLNYQDQQDLIPNEIILTNKIKHKYITVGVMQDGMLQLSGITGIIYNAIKEIPQFGESIGNLLFMPLAILQFVFDFTFTFLFLIINNWWYSILLLEIFCIIPSLKYHNYSEMVGIYISMHVKIFKFLYEVVILNIIHLIFRMVEIIRNIFRI